MSNARELALLEKWSSDGATIIPPISSPTSPKATKFCCCPNRRRYNIKQPKLTTTLHVRNIFVDNDFNFIDDPTLNENDENDDNSPQLTVENIKNYKRAESWPSARRAHKYALNSNTKLLAERKENLQQQNNVANAAEANNDYDDIAAEESFNNCNSSRVLEKEQQKSVEKKTENGDGGLVEVSCRDKEVAEADEEEEKEIKWRHNKSCHNNRNNCLTNEHERKVNSNSSSSSSNVSIVKQQLIPQQSETTVKRPLKKICGNDDSSSCSSSNEAATTTIAKNIQQQQQQQTTKGNIEYEKVCENIRKTKTNLEPNEQINTTTNTINTITTTATKTSPLIQRLSEISDLKSSLSKTNFSYKQQQQQQQQQQEHQQYCSNCQFCFNQNCRNFSQLQKSLQQQENCRNKMTVTTTTANDDKTSLVNNNETDKTMSTTTTTTTATGTTTIKSPLTCLTINTTPSATTTKMPTTTLPTSPNAHSNTPLSPLTTTVIKTTMVKRSPANEPTTTTTIAAATSPTISPALTTPTSASLSFEKSLASPLPSSTTKNIQNMFRAKEKENKPANNKNLTDATGAATNAITTATTTTLSAPLSVKERIAALVAGNEQIQKKHDNFIKHKNQCNKPMKLITQNMTCQQTQPQPQPLSQQQQQQQEQHIANDNSSNMCQKLADDATNGKSSFINDENDGSQTSVVLKTDANDNLNHKSLLPASTSASTTASLTTPSSLSLLKSSKPGSALTIPRCSQSLTNHNTTSTAANNKYGSINEATTSEVAALGSTSTTDTMTLDKTHNILSNVVLSQIAAAQPPSSSSNSSSSSSSSSLTMTSTSKHSNDTSNDKSRNSNNSNNNNVLAPSAAATKLARETSRSKLAALDNLDLALNLSNLPLDVGDEEDDDPYFELQEYLERVKVSRRSFPTKAYNS